MEVVNVINLERRKDRLEQFDRQSKEQGFIYQRWEGILIPQLPFLAISLAHRQIVQYAKDNGLSKITIAEDDCEFSAEGAWQYYLDNEPDNADIYFATIYKSDVREGKVIFGLSGLTLYTVYERFYDIFLSMNSMNHLDREIGRFAHKYNYRVCEPMVAFQSNGWSDNRLADESYEHLLEGVKLFGR